MKYCPVQCNSCGIIFYRSNGRITESKKFSWKTYCSSSCLARLRNKQVLLRCSNPLCGREFKRRQSELKKSTFFYCSQRCAAQVNNSKHPKRHALRKICIRCGKEFTSLEKYCSRKCKNQGQTIGKEEIIEKIRAFFKSNGRIPLKREFVHAKAARNRFGTWNSAILAAGFSPNPVQFAKKYIANDGHKCDSLAEKIIDDWLSAKGIPHKRNVPYNHHQMTADFQVKDFLIEFFGLQGQVERYDELIDEKEKLWKEKSLKVIKIYPNDLFPENKLHHILQF